MFSVGGGHLRKTTEAAASRLGGYNSMSKTKDLTEMQAAPIQRFQGAQGEEWHGSGRAIFEVDWSPLMTHSGDGNPGRGRRGAL